MPTGLENRVNPVETIIAEVMRRSGGADQTTEREIVKDVITPAVTDEEFVEDRSFVPAEGTEMGDVNIPTPLPTTSGFPSDSELVQAIGEEPICLNTSLTHSSMIDATLSLVNIFFMSEGFLTAGITAVFILPSSASVALVSTMPLITLRWLVVLSFNKTNAPR